MSTRPYIPSEPVIVNGSMALTLTSLVTIIQRLSMISYSVLWSGSTPLGNIQVQVSNDYSEYPDGSVHNAGTWNPLPLAVSGTEETSIPISGNTGNGFIDIDQLGGYAIRLQYLPTSGTGTLNVIMNAKVS